MLAGSGAKNLYAHVRYISRSGAGKEGEKAALFDKEQDGVDGLAFFKACQDDRHHFRMIVSPENGHAIEGFQGYVRQLMAKMEADLGTELEWVSAVHYDTDDVHTHVIIRGVNDRGEDLVIGRDYIAAGIRGRAQEIATELLGERSLEELQKSMEQEVDALRVTSLDRFIEKRADERWAVDVRKENSFGKSSHYEGLVKGRLKYLEASGLAIEYPPGVYTLKENYQETLAQISERNDVIKRLYKRIDTGLDNLSVYSVRAGKGQMVEGRVVDKGFMDEITDRKYVVVRDFTRKLHYVPLGASSQYDDLENGLLVRVRPGDASTGKADYNINLIARQNEGVYDPDKHCAYIEREMAFLPEEDRPRYLGAHVKRLETLEQNGIVQAIGDGRYQVPADVIERGAEITRKINEREKKRFYPRLDVLSKEPVEQLVAAMKKTWLDLELYRRGKGKSSLASYDEDIKAALAARQEWLVKHDLGLLQSNGQFALRQGALLKLDKLEVHAAGRKLAAKAGLNFSDRQVREGDKRVYLGCITLETGLWAVVATDKVLQMAQLKEKPEVERGQNVIVKEVEAGQFVLQEVERGQGKAKGRSEDKDQEREM